MFLNFRLQIVHSTGLSGKGGVGLSFFLTAAFRGGLIALVGVFALAVVLLVGVVLLHGLSPAEKMEYVLNLAVIFFLTVKVDKS